MYSNIFVILSIQKAIRFDFKYKETVYKIYLSAYGVLLSFKLHVFGAKRFYCLFDLGEAYVIDQVMKHCILIGEVPKLFGIYHSLL